MTSLPTTSTSFAATLRGQLRRRLTSLTWPLIWVGILAVAGGVSLRAVSVMTENPPLPDCTSIGALGSDSERLLCARASVETGSAQAMIEAIELVEPWDSGHPLYLEANRLMDRWSKALLDELEVMVERGERDHALALAERIPERVSVYPQVKGALATWDKEWAVGSEIETDVLKAIEARDWMAARRGLQRFQILNSNYWVRTRHDQLETKVDREETARRLLTRARNLARTDDLDKIGEALALTKDINLETVAWEESRAEVDEWAQQVLQYSFQKWEKEDIEAAIEVVQLVPPDLAVTQEARDLISFGHAQRLAADLEEAKAPSYGQIYNLVEAIQAVQRISPDSPFYIEAQDSLSTWRKTLDDAKQLQYASTLSQMGHEQTFRWAIAEAQKITQERPQRLQAQTLVSHWQQEIERIEDRPILVEALALAKKGGKDNLQAAIDQAAKVEQGRALRIEGQTYIAEWEDRIEIIEDQPILDKAVELATGGSLKEAIAQAGEVESGRALYADAQIAIGEWTTELQTIEDRPILIDAQNLAARGSLTAAIGVAAQIAPGRALYNEAQTSIAIWEDERAYIWSLEAPAEDSYADDGYSDDGYGYEYDYNEESFIDSNGYDDSYGDDF